MRIRRFESVQQLQSETAALLAGALAEKRANPFAVMLSGGQTPMPAYQLLAGRRVPVAANAHVLFSDERLVPDSSPDSNYGRVAPVLRALRIPDERVIRADTSMSLKVAADQYDADLREFLAQRGEVTLGLLGLGADGHTASLFSTYDMQRGRGRMAIPVPREVKPDRVSVSVALIEKTLHIVFLVCGPDKKPVIERMIREPMSIAAGQAVAHARSVELWIA